MTYELPDGWQRVKLGEICREDRVAIGNSDPAYATMPYLGLEHIEPNRGRILVTEDEARQSDSKSNNFRFTAEHVLYGKLRPYLNKVALPEFSGRCTTEIIPLLPVGTDRRWLAWLLRQEEVVEHAMRGKTGSRMPRTSMSEFLQLSVAVPPLDEQVRIVARLEDQLTTAERARTAALAQLAAIEAMPQALLRQIFPRSPSASLTRRWRWVKLGEVCEMGSGGTPTRGNTAYFGGSIPWVIIGDLNDDVVKMTSQTITDLGLANSAAKLVPAGALLIAMYGSIGKLGIAGVELTTNQAIAHIIPHSDLDVQWLFRYLRADRERLGAAGSGITQSNISQTVLKQWDVPIPPIDEQRRIVRELDEQTAAIERARAAAQAQLDAIDTLPTAALRLAFTP